MSTIVTRASKGSALTWTEGDANFTNLNDDKIERVSDDFAPQLGGNLDVNGHSVVSVSNGDIVLAPNGTGLVQAQADLVVGYGTGAANVSSLGAHDLVLSTNEGTDSGTITITDGANGNITITPNGTGDVHLVTDALRIGDLNTEARISTYGTGNLVLTTNEGHDPDPTITIGNGANADITLTPSGTGDVILSADTVQVGDSNANATITTNGTGDLILNTNNGSNSGSITIQDAANGNITVSPNGTGIVVSDKSVQLQATSELRFADTDSSNYVGFKAPGTVSTNRIWTLPATDGTAGQLLSTNGSGVLSWATDATGGGGATATTRAVLECSNHNQISGTLYRITFNGTVFHENISPSIITFSDSNNRITLAAGTYMFDQKFTRDTTSGFTTSISNISLYNVTDGVSTLTPYERFSTTYFYFKYQKFTIASSKTFEFRYDSSNPVNRSTPDFITLFKIS
jgi:hypothetical protein